MAKMTKRELGKLVAEAIDRIIFLTREVDRIESAKTLNADSRLARRNPAPLIEQRNTLRKRVIDIAETLL